MKRKEMFKYDDKVMAFVAEEARKFKCPSCGEVSTQDRWDNKTLEMCVNRSERRKYCSIATRDKVRRWYKCPECGQANYNYSIKEVFQDQ